jgi:tRNA A-37 threonylcarbamoyl transferase component Bud32
VTSSAIDIGQIVAGRYRVEQILGRGGMGVVAAVRHLELDETFALKVMTPEAFVTQEAVERFVREARTTAKLRSIHAVKVVDTGRLPDGAPYLVMEYLQGCDLEKELRARGPLPPAEIASYALQACDVLAEAHAAGVVHRDLKPANLFLTRLPNGSRCIKVLDFGIAKQTDPAKSSMTQTTSVFGTPLYMSPEQMKSAKSVDARSDIWSLGVVIYELATGALPYDAESMTELVAKVMTEAPIPIRQRQPGLMPAFDQVVSRCLERDPRRRYGSAAELAAALAPIAAMAVGRASVPDFGSQSFGPVASGTGPNPAYGTGPNPAYGMAPAAPNRSYGAPVTGSAPAYGTGPNPAYGTGPNPAYGTGPNPAYGMPAAGHSPSYGATGPTPTLGNAATQMAVTSQGGGAARGGSKVPLLALAAVLAVGSAIGVAVALGRSRGEPASPAGDGPTATAQVPAATVPPPVVLPGTATDTPAATAAPTATATATSTAGAPAVTATTVRPPTGKPTPKPTSRPTAPPTATPGKPHGGFL